MIVLRAEFASGVGANKVVFSQLVESTKGNESSKGRLSGGKNGSSAGGVVGWGQHAGQRGRRRWGETARRGEQREQDLQEIVPTAATHFPACGGWRM
jgi:hypothetical protein